MNKSFDIVGIIPAAGFASRISSLTDGSKELYPIKQPKSKLRVVSSYLIENFKEAGVRQIYVVLRNGKWDIPEYYRDGSAFGLNIAYIVVDATNGVPNTINYSYPFIKEKMVLFGFPDILFNPANAFVSLLEKQEATGADLVLGLFKSENPQKTDMVVFNDEDQIKDIVIKPKETSLIYTWIIAVWTPVFSAFLNSFIINGKSQFSNSDPELQLGDAVCEAIKADLAIDYVTFDDGIFLDIGTPADLKKVNSGNWMAGFNFSE